MSSDPKTLLTGEEYLAIERQAEFRSEFHEGQMLAMAGASRRHNKRYLRRSHSKVYSSP